MRLKSLLFPLVVVVLLVVACTGNTAYHHYEHVRGSGWRQSDTLHFRLPEATRSGHYPRQVGLRYGNAFPYEGVWMVVETRLHHPSRLLRDTLYFRTSDDNGQSMGDGINLEQHEVAIGPLYLSRGQQAEVAIYHIMHREIIPNILDVGLKLTRPNPDRNLPALK